MQENQGQNRARNVGIAAASGEIITILDSDDQDYGSDLSPVAALFRERPELDGVFTGTLAMSDGRLLGDMTHVGRVFGQAGFVDGTYSGEYQAFLRKRALRQPVFEEGLGIVWRRRRYQ